MKYFTDEEWDKMPRQLRRKWWEATDYGKKEPPKELVQELKMAVANVHN